MRKQMDEVSSEQCIGSRAQRAVQDSDTHKMTQSTLGGVPGRMKPIKPDGVSSLRRVTIELMVQSVQTF